MSEETIDPRDLTPHPKNAEMYGDPEPSERFITDIRGQGIVDPITVTEDSHFADGVVIISGHRRAEAARQTDRDVPIGEYATYDSPANELGAMLRYNDQREKTFSQRMGEADAIGEIEERAADERAGNPLQEFAGGETGLSRDKIAERVGLGSGETYRKAQKVWDAANNEHAVAQSLVTEIDTGEISIHGAYTTLQQIEGFETTEVLEGMLDELLEGGELSSDDIRRLKTSDAPSVMGWLSKNGILPLADGTLEASEFTMGGDEKVPDIVEYAEIPTESINTECCQSAFSMTGKKGIDDKLFAVLSRMYKNHEIGPSVNVAPTTGGEFELLDYTLYTAFEACALTHDTIRVHIRNVDGTDEETLKGCVRARAMLSDIQSSDYTIEEYDRLIEDEEDPELFDLLKLGRERKLDSKGDELESRIDEEA